MSAYSAMPRYGVTGAQDAPPSTLSRFPVIFAALPTGILFGLALATLFHETETDDVTTTEKDDPRA